MERTYQKALVSIISLILLPTSVLAIGEYYPTSRFGSSPEKPDLGGEWNPTHDHEADGIPGSSADRRPAGLEFSQSTGQVAPRPVVDVSDAPKTLINTNPIPDSAKRNGSQELALIASELGFFPKTLIVTRDVPVRLFVTGASKKSLCFMLDLFQVRKQIRASKIEEVNFLPTVAGRFRFHCPINGVEGTLLVKEALSDVKMSGKENIAAVSRSNLEPTDAVPASEPSQSEPAKPPTPATAPLAGVEE